MKDLDFACYLWIMILYFWKYGKCFTILLEVVQFDKEIIHSVRAQRFPKKKHLPPGTNTYVCVTRERDIRGHPLSKCARFSKKLTFLTTDTNTYVFVTRERDVKGHPLKALSQVWYNFWQLKALLKWWKMLFISPQKLFSFSRYLSFCLDFWSCFKMVWLKMSILNFMTSEPS